MTGPRRAYNRAVDTRGLLALAFVLLELLNGCAAPSTYLGPEDRDAADVAPSDTGPEASPADAPGDSLAEDRADRGATDVVSELGADLGPDASPDAAGADAVVDGPLAGDASDAPGADTADAAADRPEAPPPDGPCGVPGSACCGALCGTGATCASGLCVACGTEGAPCCGVLCGGGLECVSGTCRAACPGATTRCGARCADTNTDNANCGACGRACALDSLCAGGACVPRCAPPSLFCGGGCADVLRNTANCGACGRACAATEACVAGVCRGPFRGMVEDFEAGAWTTPPWMDTGVRLGGVGPEVTPHADMECAHDGARGGYETGTYRVRPDVIVGFPGQRVSMWYRNKPTDAVGRTPNGLAFLGVSYGTGAWSVVLPAGGRDFEIDRAFPWHVREPLGYTRERLPFSGGWFRVELSFAAGQVLTARLFDATGATQVASLTVTVPGFLPGPLVVATDWVCVDTVTVAAP